MHDCREPQPVAPADERGAPGGEGENERGNDEEEDHGGEVPGQFGIRHHPAEEQRGERVDLAPVARFPDEEREPTQRVRPEERIKDHERDDAGGEHACQSRGAARYRHKAPPVPPDKGQDAERHQQEEGRQLGSEGPCERRRRRGEPSLLAGVLETLVREGGNEPAGG